MCSDEAFAVCVVDDVEGVERTGETNPWEHGGDGCNHFFLGDMSVLATNGVGAETVVASAEGGEHAEGDEFAVLEVDAVAGVELPEAVAFHETDDVLLSFGRRFLHVFGIAFAPEGVYHLAAFLVLVLFGGGGLVVERKTDVVVVEHFVHGEQEVDDARESEEGDGLVDDFTNFAWLDADVECCVYMDAELGQCVASDGGCEDAHDACLLDDGAVGNFQCVVEGEIVEDGCEFGVTLEGVHRIA